MSALAKPQRPLAIPFRPSGRRSQWKMVPRQYPLRPNHHDPLLLGLKTFRRRRPSRHRLVFSNHRCPLRLEGPAGLFGCRCLRLANHRLARRRELGNHQGGYTPFEFDLTPHITAGKNHRLILRVDDTRYDFKLEGKQGYGRAAGIWQTAYLETRPIIALNTVQFSPNIDSSSVTVNVNLDRLAPHDLTFRLQFKSLDRSNPQVVQAIRHGSKDVKFDVAMDNPRLWTLDGPYLYEIEAVLQRP